MTLPIQHLSAVMIVIGRLTVILALSLAAREDSRTAFKYCPEGGKGTCSEDITRVEIRVALGWNIPQAWAEMQLLLPPGWTFAPRDFCVDPRRLYQCMRPEGSEDA